MSGEVKHTFTPGPWWIAGKGTIRHGDPDSIQTGWIANVNWRNREANARLIAASPELAGALSGLLEKYVELVNCGDCGNWNPEDEAEVIAARAALAKAGS